MTARSRNRALTLEQKLQRLNALRDQRISVDAEITALERDIDIERDHVRDRRQGYEREDGRKRVHIESPAPVRREQTLKLWGDARGEEL